MYKSYAQQLLAESKNLKAVERRSGVSYRTLDDFKRGKTDIETITVGTFIGIARGLGITAEELYYGSNEPIKIIDKQKEEILSTYDSVTPEGKQALHSYATKIVADDYGQHKKSLPDTDIPSVVGE